MQEILHNVTIEQRKNIIVGGVESVKAFSENKIELCLLGVSTHLFVTGTGMKITGFSKQSGNFTASGNIDGVRYGGSLKSKIFK